MQDVKQSHNIYSQQQYSKKMDSIDSTGYSSVVSTNRGGIPGDTSSNSHSNLLKRSEMHESHMINRKKSIVANGQASLVSTSS